MALRQGLYHMLENAELLSSENSIKQIRDGSVKKHTWRPRTAIMKMVQREFFTLAGAVLCLESWDPVLSVFSPMMVT